MAETGTLKTLETQAARLREELQHIPVFVEWMAVQSAIQTIRKSRQETNGVAPTYLTRGDQTIKVTQVAPKREGRGGKPQAQWAMDALLIIKDAEEPISVEKLLDALVEHGTPVPQYLQNSGCAQLRTWLRKNRDRLGIVEVTSAAGQSKMWSAEKQAAAR